MQSNKNSWVYELILTALFAAIVIVMAVTPLGFIPLVVINATTIHIPVIIGSIFLGPKKGAFLGFVFGFTSFLKSTLAPASMSAFVFSPVIAVSTLSPEGAAATVAVVLKSLFIAFVPRILIGVVPYFVYVGIKKAIGSDKKVVYGSIINAVASFIIGFGVHAFLANMIPDIAGLTTGIIGVVVGAVAFGLIEYLFMNKNAKALAFITAGIAGAMTNTLLVMGGIFVLYKEPYSEAVGVAADALLAIIGGVISFNGVIEAIVAAIIVYLVGSVLDKIKPAGIYAGKDMKIKAVASSQAETKMAQ
ncbi:MAG: ECF transporter S component [Pseudobutyrivibrio sp.]|nr:ECF transporter S component [Pseudobutyrivibrio sp.]